MTYRHPVNRNELEGNTRRGEQRFQRRQIKTAIREANREANERYNLEVVDMMLRDLKDTRRLPVCRGCEAVMIVTEDKLSLNLYWKRQKPPPAIVFSRIRRKVRDVGEIIRDERTEGLHTIEFKI